LATTPLSVLLAPLEHKATTVEKNLAYVHRLKSELHLILLTKFDFVPVLPEVDV
jgi:hypothetical protein